MPILAFLVAAAYVPGLMSPAAMPRWGVLAVGLPLVWLSAPFAPSPPRGLAACLGIALGWALVASLAWAPSYPQAAFEWTTLALLCGVALASADEPAGLDATMTGFCWGLAPSGVLAAAQWLHGDPPAGLFGNPEVLAEVCAPVAIWAALSRRWWGAAVMAIPLALDLSRVGLLAVVVAGLYAWKRPKPWVRAVAAGPLIVIAGCLSIILLGPDKLANGLSRIILWISAAALVEPFGHGLGWWGYVHEEMFAEFAHSDALQYVVEFGLGAMFLLAVPVMALSTRNPADDPLRAAFVAGCVECLVSFPLHLPASGFLVAALGGGLAGGGLGDGGFSLLRRAASRAMLRRQHQAAD